MMRGAGFAVRLLLLLVVCAFGCDGENKTTGWPDTPVETATSTAAVIDPTVAGTDTGAMQPETSAGATVLVVLEDATIGLPTADLGAGPTIFTVTNSGTAVHDLRVEGGEGISVEIEGTIASGESKTMSVNLKPGKYEVYCPILDHRERGQRAEFTIAQ